mgnify:FL=1
MTYLASSNIGVDFHLACMLTDTYLDLAFTIPHTATHSTSNVRRHIIIAAAAAAEINI